jgi:hypothetical protein
MKMDINGRKTPLSLPLPYCFTENRSGSDIAENKDSNEAPVLNSPWGIFS